MNFHVYWDQLLGQGSEGSVYSALCLDTYEMVAIKVANCRVPDWARLQLANEVQRALRISGSRVITPIDWNVVGPIPFIVFPLASGTLEDEMNRMKEANSCYHPVIALERIRDILLSLGEVHQSGEIHRDVKPSNILLHRSIFKLADFGLCRTIGRPLMQQTQGLVGTPKYASPEQRIQWVKVSVDHRSDLYSVGVILYEMLMGFTPEPFHVAPLLSTKWRNMLPSLQSFVNELLSVFAWLRPPAVEQALGRVDKILEEYRRLNQQALAMSRLRQELRLSLPELAHFLSVVPRVLEDWEAGCQLVTQPAGRILWAIHEATLKYPAVQVGQFIRDGMKQNHAAAIQRLLTFLPKAA